MKANDDAIVQEEKENLAIYQNIHVVILGDGSNADQVFNGLSEYASKIDKSVSSTNIGAIVVDNGTILIVDSMWAETQDKQELADALGPIIKQGTPIITIGDMSDIIMLTGNSMPSSATPIITYGIKVFQDGGRACYLGGGLLSKEGEIESSIGSAYVWASQWVSNIEPEGKYSLGPPVSVIVEAPDSVLTSAYWQWVCTYEYNSNNYFQPYGKMNVQNSYYKLTEDGSSLYDWYDAQICFESVPGKVAWGNSYVTMHMHNDYDANWFTGHYGDQLNEASPGTTSGQSTTSVTVGVQAGSNGAGFTLQMGWSYTTPDVSIQYTGDLSLERAIWKHELENGKDVSKYTYDAKPGYCVRGANGNGVYIFENYTIAWGKKNMWGQWQVYKDGGVVLNWGAMSY